MKPLSSVEGRRALEVVVCLEDSILDVIHLRAPGQVRAGRDPGCQVVLPADTPENMVLASMDATGQGYAARALDASGGLRPIEPNENVSLESGRLRVFVRTVPDTQSVAGGGWGLDRQSLRVVAASLLGHLAFVWLLLAIPPDARAVNGMDFYRENRLIKLNSKPTEDALQQAPKRDGQGTSAPAEGAQAAAHSGPSGKMGDPQTTSKGATALKGTDLVDKMSASERRQWASTQGLLGVMRATDWSPITGGDQLSGSKEIVAYGGDLGAPIGDSYGSLGAGYKDTGTGGCPPDAKYCSDRTIGSGRWKTIGNGPGDGFEGTGPGARLHGRGHDPVPLPKIDGAIVGPDGLDKNIIRRYVRAQLAAIGYCYERQLTVQENLGGTVTVEFVIGPTGAVISARSEGSVGSAEVDACVVAEVRKIDFPRSEGMTNVRYPFTFHAAGQ
jgi:TonB family protein